MSGNARKRRRPAGMGMPVSIRSPDSDMKDCVVVGSFCYYCKAAGQCTPRADWRFLVSFIKGLLVCGSFYADGQHLRKMPVSDMLTPDKCALLFYGSGSARASSPGPAAADDGAGTASSGSRSAFNRFDGMTGRCCLKPRPSVEKGECDFIAVTRAIFSYHGR